MIRRTLGLSLASLALVLVFAAPHSLHAASTAGSDVHHESNAHESQAHEASLRDLLYPTINFSIYLFIVIRYVIPAMREFLRRRRSDLMTAEAESSDTLARAEQEIAAKRARFAALAAEAESIRRDFVAVADRQAKRLVEQAEETGKRRLTDATLVAEQERRRALGEVRAEIAKLATGLAEREIRARLTPDDQRAFVQRFLKDAVAR